MINRMKIFLLVYLASTSVVSKVSWKLSTIPVIFGKDIVLDCKIDDKSWMSKDCPVRQWSGGSDHKGLVYNGYSSNKTKYGEYLESYSFSLIIKQLSESDVNVLYTCSCGFDSFTHSLLMEKNTFHYPPVTRNMSFNVEKGLLHVLIEFTKVFPLPTCWLYVGVTLISKLHLIEYHRNGMVYSSTYELKYQLQDKTCKNEPMVKCDFNGTVNPVKFTKNVTINCPINIQHGKNAANTTHVSKNQTSSDFDNEVDVFIPGILVTSGILVLCLVLLCLYRKCSINKDTVTKRKQHRESSVPMM